MAVNPSYPEPDTSSAVSSRTQNPRYGEKTAEAWSDDDKARALAFQEQEIANFHEELERAAAEQAAAEQAAEAAAETLEAAAAEQAAEAAAETLEAASEGALAALESELAKEATLDESLTHADLDEIAAERGVELPANLNKSEKIELLNSL